MVEPQNAIGITVYATLAFGGWNCFKMGTVQKRKKGGWGIFGEYKVCIPTLEQLSNKTSYPQEKMKTSVSSVLCLQSDIQTHS